MPRIPRLIVRGEEAVYHVISRTALDGFVIEDEDKEYLLGLIKWLSSVFFVEILGFCIMGNHFHLLVKVFPGERFSDEDVMNRAKKYYGKLDKKVDVERFRQKCEMLSEFIKEIKQRFARYYNKKHDRRGYFWGERFKSVLLEDGPAVLNCLAYIDLNPVRAGLVKRPEEYRWCSISYHMAMGESGGFLSKDLGLSGTTKGSFRKRLRAYREYLYEKGGLVVDGKGAIDGDILCDERQQEFTPSTKFIFKHRVRYFSDGAILGSKLFVKRWYSEFKDYFKSKEKLPRKIPGVEDVYSLKRLSRAGIG